MPTIRYQIWNEYGSADPELHRAADNDDPEAILEGVAMAGLVGVLRQLGDLSEFAAEIFRDLHEEVMGTAARGNELMLRVQQLEAEVPSVEKAVLSQSDHSNCAYNDGIDWHCNIQIDQNIIAKRDMPRFVLDSYEECHGPPRLFTLDKFDTAGAGACLKRYTDPSFFKMDLASSGSMETEIPREKKSRKTRKKGSRWKNGQTLESLFSPKANFNSQPTTSDQVAGKSAARLVRLKPRNLNEKNGDTGGSLRKCLLQMHSDNQKVAFDNYRSSSNGHPQPVVASESASEMYETFMDATMKASKHSTRLTTYELHDGMIEDEEFSGLHEPFAKAEDPHKGIDFAEDKEIFTDSENNSEGSAYDNELSNIVKTTSLLAVDHKFVGVEEKLEGSTDGYRTEDICSEQENFMEALNIMESEVDIDSENIGGSDIDTMGKETHKMNAHTSETPEQLQTEVSELDGAEVSSESLGLNNVSKIEISESASNSSETPKTQEKTVASDWSNSEICLGQTHDENCEELLPNDEVAWSTDCISAGASSMMTFDNQILSSQEISKEHCSSYDASSTCDFTKSSPHESFEPLQPFTPYQIDRPTNHEAQFGTYQTVDFLDGSPYPDQCFLDKTHPVEDVEEDRTTMPEMFHQCEDLLSTTMPKMQDLVDRETKAFSLKENTTNISKGSILTTISDSVPVVSRDDTRHDEIAADTSNCQYPEESTTDTYDYMMGIDNTVVAHVNAPSVGNKDQRIPEKPDFACIDAELISGEMALNYELPDYPSKTDDKSIDGNFADGIDVPSHPSNATVGEPLESISQYADVCPRETASLAVPVIAAISSDYTTELEDTVVDNLEVGFENANGVAKSDLEISKILQPLLEYFSDTEESQESPKVNSVELQESFEVNFAEQFQLDPKSGPDRTTDSPMLAFDNSKMPNEFIQENPYGNVQGLKGLTAEYCIPEDESDYADLSNVNTQAATSPELQLLEDSTDVPYQYQLKTHETCSLQTTEACHTVEESAPEPVDPCLQCSPVEDFASKCVAQGGNLTAENFASEDETNYCDLSSVCTQEAADHGLQLLEDSTDVVDQYQLKTHEICGMRTMEAVDSQSTLNEEVCPRVQEITPQPVQKCLESLAQGFDLKCLAQDDFKNSKQEMSISTDLNSIPASSPEEFSISQASNEVKVELGSLDQMAECPEPVVQSNSMDVHDKPSGVEPNYHAPMGNLDYDELNIPTPTVDETIQHHSEALISPKCSSEIFACDFTNNILGLTLPSMSNSDISAVERTSRMLHQPHPEESNSCFASQNFEEPPPLPPLPPLGWRSRKLQLNSLMADSSFQSLCGANQFMATSGNKTANPFLAPPMVVDHHQLESPSFSGKNLESSKVPSLTFPSLEHEKSLYDPVAEEKLKLALADSLTPLSLSESQISQHSAIHEEKNQSVPDRLHDKLLPDLELEESQYTAHTCLSFEKEMVQSQNPFFVQSTKEDDNYHHSYRDFGGEKVHPLKPMELTFSSGLEMPQPGFVYSLEGSRHSIFGVEPIKEDELFGMRLRSIRDRPRNPLMEAVVAHDRSTLRKVSEIAKPENESEAGKEDALLQSNILQLRKVPEAVKPSNESKAEGKDALLEQIRNKSFSLKPAVVSKPSNKGHSTNITVAAIVEKANALRQAMAGSDEEDAGDSWSDC